MKVTEHIKKAKGETQFTFEILPPVKGHNVQSIFDNIDPLMEFNPPFIDVTYHREEHVYNDLGNGLLQKKVVRKRPGTVGICAALQNKYNVDAIPHILCGGFNKEITENLLIDLDFLGINNVVALRGDAIKSETYFTPSDDGHSYASELVNQISELNKGKYLEELEVSSKTDFCIGVSGYPEKHMEAPSIESDIHFLKEKIKLGADYIVTQRFHCDLPEALIKEVIKCKDNSQVKEVGIEWCIEQSKELKKAGVPFLHYYSMGKAKNIKKIASKIF